jgi:hypothetical protein
MYIDIVLEAFQASYKPKILLRQTEWPPTLGTILDRAKPPPPNPTNKPMLSVNLLTIKA